MYNESYISSRNTIERCFGVWKRWFSILYLGMRVSLENSKAIVAAAVLHNLAINENNGIPQDEVRVDEEDDVPLHVAENNGNNNNNVKRMQLVNNHFTNLL